MVTNPFKSALKKYFFKYNLTSFLYRDWVDYKNWLFQENKTEIHSFQPNSRVN